MGTIGKVRKVCGKAKKKKSYEKWNETENAPRETQRKSMSAYGDAIALMPAAVLLLSLQLPLFWVEFSPFCKDTTFPLPPACGKTATNN